VIHPEQVSLADRARIVYAPSPANPFVAFLGSIAAGVAAEPAGQPGVAELTSRALLGGTATKSAAQLARSIEGLGANLTFDNETEALLFSGRCTREAVARVLRVLREVLEGPAFPESEIEKARAEIVSDLREAFDDTRARAFHELLSRLYPRGHPYGRDPLGTEASIRRIRRRDLVAFYRRTFTAEGMIVAFSGDVDRAFVEGTIAPIIESVELDGGPPRPVVPPADPVVATRTIPMPHKSQVDLAIGGPAIARNDPQFHALSLADLLFGRIGLMGRLGETVRNRKGLAYYSFSHLIARRAGGHVQVAVGVNPANVETALESVRSEMERLRTEPFSEEELDHGRSNQIGGLAVTLERNAEVVAELHHLEFHGLGLDYLERYPGIVRGVAGEAVRTAAARFFDPDAMGLVAAGPVGDRSVRL